MQPQKGKFSTAQYFDILHGFEFGFGVFFIKFNAFSYVCLLRTVKIILCF